jgi:hypothetical protein
MDLTSFVMASLEVAVRVPMVHMSSAVESLEVAVRVQMVCTLLVAAKSMIARSALISFT